MNLEFQQKQVQTQVQVMSQRQIQALELLSLSSQDLREAVSRATNENPALIITDDRNEAIYATKSRRIRDYSHVGTAGAAGELASENFQAVLEAHPDTRETLQEHLLTQINMLNLTPNEHEVCQKLVYNLDSKGFHIMAPVTLLDRSNSSQTTAVLEKCIKIVQELDPAGTCVSNTEESLLIQAEQNEKATPLSLFILDGHLNYLDPPKTDKIIRKISDFRKEQSKLFGEAKAKHPLGDTEVTEESIEAALAFIRTLDPFPAMNYSTAPTGFIAPDIYVEKLSDDNPADSFDDGIVTDGEWTWKVRSSVSAVPNVAVNPELVKMAQHDTSNKISDSIKKAQEFMDTLKFRQSTILKASCLIVKKQSEFFRKGPGHLVPLKQQDIADLLGVHETTISRMANRKFLQCEWGLFDIKYFFVNAVSSEDNISKDNVLHAIKEILDKNTSGKNLSDQKISDILAVKGIKVARRTVAKYRQQLNIDSSYSR